MNPEYIHSRLEETSEEFRGEELKAEVETVLDKEGVNYHITSVGGLEQPKHKEYLYDMEIGTETWEVKLITYDGRPGNEDGSVKISEKH